MPTITNVSKSWNFHSWHRLWWGLSLTLHWRYVCSCVFCYSWYYDTVSYCRASATNKTFLRLMGITHILNTAEGSRNGQVDTGHAYYRDMPNIRYMGFPMTDHPSTDISRYFYIASKFIENGIDSGGKSTFIISILIWMLMVLFNYRKSSCSLHDGRIAVSHLCIGLFDDQQENVGCWCYSYCADTSGY